MEFVIALVGLGIGFVLARRGFLHPYDYVQAAALAGLLALCVVPAIPGDDWARVFQGLGAPQAAVARDAFFAQHGMTIVLACALFAVGACLEGWLRYQREPRYLD